VDVKECTVLQEAVAVAGAARARKRRSPWRAWVDAEEECSTQREATARRRSPRRGGWAWRSARPREAVTAAQSMVSALRTDVEEKRLTAASEAMAMMLWLHHEKVEV
jgi:hypothetical protein